MFYKPKYCCNCSEKIERVKWNLRTSRRFCQLCETEFVAQEWIPRLIVAFGLIIGIVGLTGYFQKPTEKPLKISASNLSGNISQAKKDLSAPPAGVPIQANSNVQTPAQSSASLVEQRRKQTPMLPPAAQNAQPEAAKNQLNSAEQVYFCGAATKKSTVCSRRVKGGGRCWQHAGQPAILPPEKLIARR